MKQYSFLQEWFGARDAAEGAISLMIRSKTIPTTRTGALEVLNKLRYRYQNNYKKRCEIDAVIQRISEMTDDQYTQARLESITRGGGISAVVPLGFLYTLIKSLRGRDVLTIQSKKM